MNSIQAFKLALLFPNFSCAPTSLFFSESALLSLHFSPKMFEVTKYCNFFFLARFDACIKTNQLNLSNHNAKVYKMFLLQL